RASGSSGLGKSGPGTLTLSGSSPNTYGSSSPNGNTTVNAGTLVLSKSAGVVAVANGSLVLNGGVLLLAPGDQIAASVPLILNGGVFKTGGSGERLGTLTLASNSAIDLGTGASFLRFDNSSALAWTAGATLTVSNWSGSTSGGGTDQLIFDSNSTALT